MEGQAEAPGGSGVPGFSYRWLDCYCNPPKKDDLVVENAYVRLEQMDETSWWLGVGPAGKGILLHLYLSTDDAACPHCGEKFSPRIELTTVEEKDLDPYRRGPDALEQLLHALRDIVRLTAQPYYPVSPTRSRPASPEEKKLAWAEIHSIAARALREVGK